MRRILLPAFLPVLVLFAQPVFAAEPIEGNWLTPKGAVVSITACDAGFCLSGKDGKAMGSLTGSGGHYEGAVVNPENGKSNTAKIDIGGDTLTISGCAGIICASRDWTRQ